MSLGYRSDNLEWIESLEDAPFTCMNASSRLHLCNALAHTVRVITAASGVTSDWRGLGELLRFSYDEIETIAEEEKEPLKGLLRALERKVERGFIECPDLKQLMTHLYEMERFDILEDPGFRASIGRDVDRYRQYKILSEEQMQTVPKEVDQDFPRVFTGPSRQQVVRNYPAREVVLVEDTPLGAPAPNFPTTPEEEMRVVEGSLPTMDDIIYDAFISYTGANWWFVERMLVQLEGSPHSLRLCVDIRDILAGGSKNTITASIIEQRCKKTILVISPEYFEDPDCEFHYKFSQSISPGSRSCKIIPVVIATVSEFPKVLKDISKLYYVGCDNKRWFWNKLAKSVAAPVIMRSEDAALPRAARAGSTNGLSLPAHRRLVPPQCRNGQQSPRAAVQTRSNEQEALQWAIQESLKSHPSQCSDVSSSSNPSIESSAPNRPPSPGSSEDSPLSSATCRVVAVAEVTSLNPNSSYGSGERTPFMGLQAAPPDTTTQNSNSTGSRFLNFFRGSRVKRKDYLS